MVVAIRHDEEARLKALLKYNILDTEAEDKFDELTQLASYMCQTPIAFISLIDSDRQWFKSKHGWAETEAPRELAFCNRTILQNDVLIISDTLTDERFSNNPRVQYSPHVRFYAGMPLITPEGFAIGTLCVMDHKPKDLTPEQIQGLKVLSRQIITEFELQRIGKDYLNKEADRLSQNPINEANFFSLSLDMLCIAGADGYFKHLNPAWEKTFGYSIESLKSTPFINFVHPDDRAITIAELEKLFNGTPVTYFEHRYLCRDGNYKWLSWTAFPVIEQDLVYAIAQDISNRKQKEQQIRQQAVLLDVTKDAILVQDWEQQILFWNKGAENLYGWNAEEAIGQNFEQLLFKKSLNEIAEIKINVAEKGEWCGELNQVTKNGKEILVESRWVLMPSDKKSSKSILIVNTDITQKKQLEAQFLRAQRLESIGTLASGIAHDLNNVLAPILMSVQLLEKKLHDKQSKQILKTLETTTRRGADLVKQVLSFARGIETKQTIIQIRHLISEIKAIAKETFPKSIEFQVDIPRDLWTLCGNATQLHQMLMNFCLNARDAMPNGGLLRISAKNDYLDENYVQMNLEANVGPYILVEICDTGIGIPPEILDRIFEPFFTTKEFGKGTGLGLSTTLGIIKNHGGFVKVDSQVHHGTQVKVYLPAIEGTETPRSEELFLYTGQGQLILVVDDEAAIREVTKTSLETYGYKVITANDGIDAVALYAQYQQDINLVLTNMMMPFMDGSTVIRTLKKINPSINIIAVSGMILSDKMAQGADVGMQKFLLKPYTTKELLKTIHSVLVTS